MVAVSVSVNVAAYLHVHVYCTYNLEVFVSLSDPLCEIGHPSFAIGEADSSFLL